MASNRLTSRRLALKFEASARELLATIDQDQLLERLSQATIPRPYALRVKVVYARSTPAEVLTSRAGRAGFDTLGRDSSAFTYQKKGRSIAFVVARLNDNAVSERVAAVISICTSEQWRRLKIGLRKPYPALIPILLSQAEILRTVAALRGHWGSGELMVTGFSARARAPNSDGQRRGRSLREWTLEQIDDVLASIEERQQHLMSLDLRFESAEFYGQTWKIRKEGEIALNTGFRMAYDAIILPMARLGDRKLQLFSKRGLRDAEYRSKPLAIEFARPVLGDLAVVRQFVHALGRYPHSMHTILHGNPYAHVRLTDMLDGSSIDVLALEPSRIALVPGLRASEAAFNRLVQHIFDSFREGSLAATYGEDNFA